MKRKNHNKRIALTLSIIFLLGVLAGIFGVIKIQGIQQAELNYKTSINSRISQIKSNKNVIDLDQLLVVQKYTTGGQKVLSFSFDQELAKLQHVEIFDGMLRSAVKSWIAKHSEFTVVKTLADGQSSIVFEIH